MKPDRVRTYILISQFSTTISAIDFRLFFKIATVIFGLLFQKHLWLLAYFYVVVEVDDFRRIYTSKISETIPTAADKTARGRIYIYVGGYLNIYTVVAREVQRGRIYKSLARKGMFSQKSSILVVLEEAIRGAL